MGLLFLVAPIASASSPVVVTPSLPDATVTAPYLQTLAVADGTAPYNWLIIAGNLPAGLSFNGATAEISGVPTTVGIFSFTAEVVDANNESDTKSLVIVVNNLPNITTTSLPDANALKTYSTEIQATSGTPPYIWSVVGGSLPSGLSLGSDGGISGTPDTEGVFTFTVRVQDANYAFDTQQLTINVGPALTGDLITITTTPADGNRYGEPINSSGCGQYPYIYLALISPIPNTYGGTQTVVHWVSNESHTPEGTLGNITWTFSTIPNGTYGVAALCTTALDSLNNPYSFNVDPNEFRMSSNGVIVGRFVVIPNQGSFTVVNTPSPSITTNSFVNADINVAYSQTLDVVDGVGPFTWSIISGSLPSGLSLNSSTGEIFGIPTVNGLFNFTVKVNDSRNEFGTKALSIFVHGNTLVGTNVSVGPLNGITLEFGEVTSEGQTTVITSGAGQPPPTGFKFGTPPTYYSISTTAIFNSPVEVCITWTQGQFNNENNLKLWHFDGVVWTDITTSLDTVNNVICGNTTSFSDFAIFEKKQMVAIIDIKPGSYPNSINLGSNGVVPVAVLSTSDFDATTIVPLTVSLASAPVNLKGNGTPQYSFQDVNNDSLLDLIVQVSTQALQLSSTDQTANFLGYTSDNTEVIGSDMVRVVQ